MNLSKLETMAGVPLLIDLDGVLRLGDKPAPDASDFIQHLNDRDKSYSILSNTTKYTADIVKDFFDRENISIENAPVITALDTTISYVKNRFERVAVFCDESAGKHFDKYIDQENPEAVIVGDMGEEWTSAALNEIFKHVQNGAELIAMQRNKYWQNSDGELVLDAGSYIAAIEYATSKRAMLIGKPSEIFFRNGVEALGYQLSDGFIMLGDDLVGDIQGAQQNGGKAVLLMTGKTDKSTLEKSEIDPDFIAENLCHVIDILF